MNLFYPGKVKLYEVLHDWIRREKAAADLAKSNPKLLTRYLTHYSVSHAEQVVSRWKELGEHLITKYNNGYVQDEEGDLQEKGYPESWLKEVIKSRSEQFRLPQKKGKSSETK